MAQTNSSLAEDRPASSNTVDGLCQSQSGRDDDALMSAQPTETAPISIGPRAADIMEPRQAASEPTSISQKPEQEREKVGFYSYAPNSHPVD